MPAEAAFSVDAPIAPLVHEINAHADYVTTSTCSGRAALVATSPNPQRGFRGSRWLLVEHRTVTAAEVQAHEHEDTVAVPNRAPTELRDTWWARAWGVDGNASSAYVGPKTVRSGGRWLFVLVHAMRHALHVAPGLGYFFKPEMDGITCVDGMVATLRVAAAAWRRRPRPRPPSP